MNHFFRKLYYGAAYNIQFPINLSYAFGSLTPYLFLVGSHGGAGMRHMITAATITILTTYSYTPTYVLNDWIDRHKDSRLGIPKFTARHTIGMAWFLGLFAALYSVGLWAVSLIHPSLPWYMIGYLGVICLLALVHSLKPRFKYLTIFIQRFLKFCAPWGFIYIAMPHDITTAFFIGSLLVYPVSFSMDQAYRGYFRDRLHRPEAQRFIVYGAYWLLVAAVTIKGFGLLTLKDLVPGIAVYLSFYLATWLAAYGLAAAMYRLLHPSTQSPVQLQRYRLISFSAVQILMLLAGFVIAATIQ
jgi:hypothetical protein